MTISIIGSGNMGSALIKSFLSQGLVTADELTVTDPDSKKLAAWKKIGVNTSAGNEPAMSSDLLILAVKPQSFPELAKELKGKLPGRMIIVSIMAGIQLKKIQQLLGHQKVVRAMPNTPALVGSGVTGWYADKSLSKSEKDQIQELLKSTGLAFELKKESQIDDVTALSGCGPGFFFTVFDQWLTAAESLDLPQKELKKILEKTLLGSLRLLESSPDSPKELTKKVASKGGATEAGLKVLEKAQLKKIFAKTMEAAYDRCKQMAK